MSARAAMTIENGQAPPASPAARRLRGRVQHVLAFRKVKVALAAYLVTIVFGVGFIVARVVALRESPFVALGAALVVAVPLAIAFVGDRVSSIKFPGGGEVVLTAAAVPVATTVPTDEINAVTSLSDTSNMALQLQKLIAAPGSELLEVDLRDGSYWWPTRLFLLATLLNDHTDVRRLVFVLHAGAAREYVGMAKPSAVCRRLELALPGVTAAYAAARQSAVADVNGGVVDPQPFQPFVALPPPHPTPSVALDNARVVQFTAAKWPQAVRSYRPIDESQEQRVDPSWLETALGDDLRWAAISFDGPLDPLQQYRIITEADDFVALVTDRLLVRVVGRCRLATSVATAYLAWQLVGARQGAASIQAAPSPPPMAADREKTSPP